MALVHALLLSLLFSVSFSPSSALTVKAQAPTAYEVLQQYNFPVGLLPLGVASYELDPSTGKFAVHLNGVCNIKVDKYELEYESSITGTISSGKLATISGIKVRVMYIWLNIAEVERDGDNLEFSAGISASFPVSIFNQSPSCA